MSLHKIRIFAVLLVIPLLAACGTMPAKEERLIYMTPSSSVPLGNSPTSATAGVSAAASAKGESKKTSAASSSSNKSRAGGSSNAGSSKKSADSSAPQNSSGSAPNDKSGDRSSRASSAVSSSANSSSGAASTGTASTGASSAPSSGGAVTPPTDSPTLSDILSLYNSAAQKNAALSGVQFRFVNCDASKKQTTGTVRFNNDYSQPVFMVTIDQTGSNIYYTAADQSFYFYQNGNWLPAGKDTNMDAAQYVMILDPALSADDVNACSFTRVGGNRVIDISLASGFERYAEIYKIFNVDENERIENVQMQYTLSTDGYIIGAKQVFTLSDNIVLSMEKNYLDIGAAVDLTQNIVRR